MVCATIFRVVVLLLGAVQRTAGIARWAWNRRARAGQIRGVYDLGRGACEPGLAAAGSRCDADFTGSGAHSMEPDARCMTAGLRKPLGELLREAAVLDDRKLRCALDEQARSGGRLGEILVASGTVAPPALTKMLGRQLGLTVLGPTDEPLPLLTAAEARAWHAVALKTDPTGNGPTAQRATVAVVDPKQAVLAALERSLGCHVEAKLTDQTALDELLGRVYAEDESAEVTRALRDQAPDLSAQRMRFSIAQVFLVVPLTFATALGVLMDAKLMATVLVALATAYYVVSTGFRLLAAHQGWKASSTIEPPMADIARMDERALPPYTILLPLYKEKPSTVAALFDALSGLDYPKHKLDVVLLLEADDGHTSDAIEQVGRPPWMRILSLPEGTPRTKPRAMAFGIRSAKGTYVTVYDAEDKPDPYQLKKAVWAFERSDPTVACLQAKLGYYNPRQNLLTRWFTLEYDAWFNIFLPGLHRIGAPIPLGGTSNHFRRTALDECLGWDPFNVTEDADLGLRLARLGNKTAMLESTTEEEANSQLANWLRQRSRWSKGFMQTLLVHTRHPVTLFRDLGPKGALAFLLTIGGTVVTALISPIFWTFLVVWIYVQPPWVAELFPGPVYYVASLCLVLGNFTLVFLSLCAAVSRGHDDLAPHALLIPVYWVFMSVATYVALIELIVRPYHWHKTEHGLHFVDKPASAA